MNNEICVAKKKISNIEDQIVNTDDEGVKKMLMEDNRRHMDILKGLLEELRELKIGLFYTSYFTIVFPCT